MKILIVSRSFYPHNSPRSFRTAELAKELSSKGHDVTVYIPSSEFDYSDFIREHPMVIKYFNTYSLGRKITGISLIDRVIYHYEKWLINSEYLKTMLELEKTICVEKDYDLLITIAVPHYIHWAVGRLYEKGYKIATTWVADCGDSYMKCRTMANRPPFYFKPLEKRWCRFCDYITVPLESEKENYYPEFVEKIRVIPQGFNFDEVGEYVASKKNDIIVFAYAGSFIPRIRDPRPLMEYLLNCKKDFRFVIYSTTLNLIQPYKEKFGDKLEIREPIPRLELIRKLRECDFLINIDNGAAKGMPSKLIDYSLVGRPILSITSSNIDTKMIDSFLCRDYTEQFIVEDISRYDIHNVAQQFIDLCK